MSKSQRKNTPKQAALPPDQRNLLLEQKRIESRQEDAQLIKRALKGEDRAYRRLRLKYHDAIYNLIYRMIHDKEEVEDLTQEAFIKAFTSLSSFNEEYAFSTWIYRIATNNSIDYIRRRRFLTVSIDKPVETKDGEYAFELADTGFEPDEELIAAQRRKLLDDAIRSLPPKYRRVMVMRHVEEKEYQEIAQALRLPLGTIKAHIFRAREMLYRRLRSKMRHY